MKKLIVIKMI